MSDHEVEILNRKVDRILSFLDNDTASGRQGLVSEVADLKKWIHSHVAQYNIDQAIRKRDLKWTATIFSALGTTFIFIIKFLIGLIFK